MCSLYFELCFGQKTTFPCILELEKPSEFNLAIMEISRDWPRSKNDKVIVKLKKYFVEQCFNNWVHSVWLTIMHLFVWSDNWAIYAECLWSELFSRGVIFDPLKYELVTRGKHFWSLPRESILKWNKYEFRNSFDFSRALSRLSCTDSAKIHDFTVVYSLLCTRCIVYSLKNIVHIANFTMKISKIELWMIVDRFLKEILCMLGGHVLALKQFLKQ